MAAKRDYYSVLQVNPSASPAAIEAAYERLSRLYDPQTSQKLRASARRMELDEAYEVLSDPKRRSEYDRLRAKGLRPGQTLKEAPRPGNPVARGWETMWEWLDNPYVFAGIAGFGVLVILVAIVLISVLDEGGGDAQVAELSPTPIAGTPVPTPAPRPTSVPPATPPEVTGEQQVTASGLTIIDVTPGTGAQPANGDTVWVEYTGWLQADNTKFDSSLEAPTPFSFILGSGGVIPGWDEGVLTMKVGGKRRLIIPPNLAYGEAGREGIPPNATLIFDIDLLNVLPAATPAPQPTPTAALPTEAPPAEVTPTP